MRISRAESGNRGGGKDEIEPLHKMRLLAKQSRTSLQGLTQHAERASLKECRPP